MRQIYILLTRTSTIFANVIHLVTGDDYTHASIALDRDLKRMYSFGRLRPYNPFWAGFISENIHSGVFGRYPLAPCALYELNVSNQAYEAVEEKIREMESHSDLYHYNLLGTVCCQMHIQYDRPNYYFCSQFVSELLENAGAMALPKSPLMMKPSDFTEMQELHLLYQGWLFACNADGVNAQLENPFRHAYT